MIEYGKVRILPGSWFGDKTVADMNSEEREEIRKQFLEKGATEVAFA